MVLNNKQNFIARKCKLLDLIPPYDSIFRDKDIDCDIRENIINYEDEGGGEGDQTGYDLSVLRMMSDGTPALHPGGPNKMMKFSPHDAPDIQTFLQTNKVHDLNKIWLTKTLYQYFSEEKNPEIFWAWYKIKALPCGSN